jgi:hypothetical protein
MCTVRTVEKLKNYTYSWIFRRWSLCSRSTRTALDLCSMFWSPTAEWPSGERPEFRQVLHPSNVGLETLCCDGSRKLCWPLNENKIYYHIMSLYTHQLDTPSGKYWNSVQRLSLTLVHSRLAQGLSWGMFLPVTATLALATCSLHRLSVGAVHLLSTLQKYEGGLFYSFWKLIL